MALLMNSQKEFEAIFTLKREAPQNPNAIKQQLSGHNELTQYKYDVAFWYGTLIDNRQADHALFFQRVFSALYWGSLCYKDSTGLWKPWGDSGIPLASAVSHGGRVMIQVPKDPGQARRFWNWLWTGSTQYDATHASVQIDPIVNERAAATHGLASLSRPERMPRKGGVKFLKEYTPFKTAPLKDKYRSSQGKARHYGLNVALGGTGNINPFSGNRIIANGNHGHFYVFFKRPHSDRSKFAGLLLGCEGSCPIDRKQANTVTRRSNLKDNVLGLALAQSCNFPVDQTGGLHTFGHSGKFSPTGGMKWKDTSWHDAGPRKSNDAMFIDLSTPAAMKRVYDNADNFDPMWLGSTGHGGKAPPQRPSRANRRKIKQIGPLNAEELYGRIILQRTRGDWNTVGGHARTQVERDVALWYGAIVKPSTRRENWKGEMIKKLLLVLHEGGLMVNRGAPEQDNWVPWCETADPIPICAALSHTARILISLPAGNGANQFWTWLWSGHSPKGRMMATHGISGSPRRQIYPGAFKEVKETKGNPAGAQIMFDHYGVNIGLGGCGNHNPVSMKRITDDGTHGHLYIAYGKNILKAHNRRAILVGVEQSAPIDRAPVALKHIAGVPDQYGGKHALGGHNRYSATGGDDFSYPSKDKRTGVYSLKNPTELGDYGPSLGHYIDGMFIDLTAERFRRLQTDEFDADMVGSCGYPPLPSKRRG